MFMEYKIMFHVHLTYSYVIYKVKYIRLKMLSYCSKTNFSLASTMASDYPLFFLS